MLRSRTQVYGLRSIKSSTEVYFTKYLSQLECQGQMLEVRTNVKCIIKSFKETCYPITFIWMVKHAQNQKLVSLSTAYLINNTEGKYTLLNSFYLNDHTLGCNLKTHKIELIEPPPSCYRCLHFESEHPKMHAWSESVWAGSACEILSGP